MVGKHKTMRNKEKLKFISESHVHENNHYIPIAARFLVFNKCDKATNGGEERNRR